MMIGFCGGGGGGGGAGSGTGRFCAAAGAAVVATSVVVDADIAAAVPIAQSVRTAIANADPVAALDAACGRPAGGPARGRGWSSQFIVRPQTDRGILRTAPLAKAPQDTNGLGS
jgi:hypothetical protein